MKYFECEKNCQKTKMLRNSKYCGGIAYVEKGKIIFSCDKNLEKESQKVKNFFNCQFFNLDLTDSCLTCPLDCKKNKSRVKRGRDLEKEEGKRMLEAIASKYPVDQSMLNAANNALNSEISEESKGAIKAVYMAEKILEGALSGKIPDVKMLAKIVSAIRSKTQGKS